MRVEAGGHDSLLSDFPTPYLTHVDIVEAGLLSIDSDVLSAASTVESARFMNNRITHIDADAFRLAATVAGSSFRQDERGCGCTQPSFVPRPIHACAAFQSSLFFLAEVPRPELQLTHRGAPGFPRPHVGPRLAQPSQVRPTSHSTVKSKGRPGRVIGSLLNGLAAQAALTPIETLSQLKKAVSIPQRLHHFFCCNASGALY